MNRETESHFSNIPYVEKPRSKFKRPHTHKTTWNASDLIPIYVDSDILPGDTVSMDMGSVVRMTTPLYPVMDNCYMDVFFFFVPHRLVWDHWREFWGENRSTYWEQPIEYEIPQIEAPENGWAAGTLADYMGLPPGIGGISVSHLPFRAYCQIWNDWFRDQNLKDPCFMNTDETTLTGTNTGDYVLNTQLGALPAKAAKFHDYFTSALPEPQKGPDVTIPLGVEAPVKTGTEHAMNNAGIKIAAWNNQEGKFVPYTDVYGNVQHNLMTKGNGNAAIDSSTTPTGTAAEITFSNLYADLSLATSATINQLRQAFAIQRFYEAQARGGSRYIEFIKNIFGVSSPDARQQRAEYMGGYRCPINVTQVLQTGESGTSPLGQTGAFSYTPNRESVFTHSFTEHGTLMGLAVVRTDHTYQQGIERMWSRKKWTDYYVPQFANLGEQAILVKEIWATGTATDDEAFGYQEAWADYRYKPSRVSGAFRSSYQGSLDAWHYADDYSTQPILSSEWIDETSANVQRTLAVADEPQFIGDFFFDATYTRIMPVYSVPGLLDHH